MKPVFLRKKMSTVVFSVVLMLIFVSCSSNEKVKDLIVDVESISLNVSLMNLSLDGTEVLKVTFHPVEATDQRVSWSSSDNKVATVSGGTVKAAGVGTAIITAKSSNGKIAECTVTVSSSVINAEGVELDKSSLSLIVGTSGILTATVKPLNATDKTIVWESNNTQIATVDNSGRVSGVSIGVAKITAKAGSFSAVCDVSVTREGIPATKIELNKTSLSLTEGAEEQLKATVFPENTTDIIAWQSQNPQIAVVDNKGNIKAVGLGTTNVIAKAGDKTETCVVTVTPVLEPEIVTAIVLSKTSLPLINGGSEAISATVTTTDGSKPVVSWSSSNIQIASVDDKGVVTAVGVGEAIITATAGNKSAICTVTVTPASEQEIVTAIVLSKTSLTLMTGGFDAISATVTTTDGSKPAVAWVSSNAQVASVDGSGNIAAEGVGEAIITATAGNKSATCTVTVTSVFVAITGVKVSPSAYTMHVGEEIQLSAQITPLNSTSKDISWQSQKPHKATVDIETGLVKALSAGKVTIFAIVEENRDITSFCEITIVPAYIPVTSLSLNETNLVLTENETYRLNAIVMPSDATVQAVIWTSQDESVATVDGSGNITARSEGTTVITAEADGKFAFCNVKVEAQDGQTIVFGDPVFEAFLLGQFDADGNGKISTSEVKDVTSLDCRSQNISSLVGIEHFKSLTFLDCSHNNLSSVDSIKRNLSLTSFDCRNNHISSLEVGTLTNLVTLKCSNNNLSAIDVSRNSLLEVFFCSGNNLSHLDVSANPVLTQFYCTNNNLSFIDVSQNSKLAFFSCGENPIGNLDVSNNLALNDLYCQNCNLTSLLLNNNPKLTHLNCSNNNLSSLDILANEKLSTLDCSHNRILGDLDISASDNISMLDCRSNDITNLYISPNVWDLLNRGEIKPSSFNHDDDVVVDVK
ncbi:MAG: Ig-like domain-containing protein [Tannerella sp.]|jgi:uncharacterized protein YjdB|nr:Ig-like domain-containing protein [Tannerella sp.]